eukprot:67509-Chlamydomonas_euryale.AAC.1
MACMAQQCEAWHARHDGGKHGVHGTTVESMACMARWWKAWRAWYESGKHGMHFHSAPCMQTCAKGAMQHWAPSCTHTQTRHAMHAMGCMGCRWQHSAPS